MKKLSTALLALSFLAGCQTTSPSHVTPAEKNMAEMMGITVDELRNQSPEEHMQMMQRMMQGGNHGNMNSTNQNSFLPAMNQDISALPEAKPSETLVVNDGDTITLSPTLVRKTLNGKAFAMYGYNGQVPGPIIKATQASTITVNVTNSIDMDTTIHWHGVRLSNKNDGVPGVTQETIHPGGTYTYTVHLPDEGIYWYHPHVREDIQQDMGLYGNLLVSPSDKNAYAPVNTEAVVVLDDLLLDAAGSPIPYGKTVGNYALMGRFGNLLLVNGAPAKDYSLTVKRGDVVRFYLTNVANTRTMRIRIDGGAMKLVGADVGRYEKESWVDTVTLAPAERAIVDVLFEDDGRYPLLHETPFGTEQIGSVTVTSQDADPSYESDFMTLHTHQDVVQDIEKFRPYFDKPVDKTLTLHIDSAGMMGMMNHMMMDEADDSGIEWEDSMPGMNAAMTSNDLHWKITDVGTTTSNMDIPWKAKVGDVLKIRIENPANSAHPMQHPMHFHGQRFLVLSTNDVPNENLAWKDTVLVPAGGSADILMDVSNPGDWMFHCHIAEHLTNGMMGMFHVSP